jgi:hypothetical protein
MDVSAARQKGLSGYDLERVSNAVRDSPEAGITTMPWRFSVCLATVILAATSGIARAQAPPGYGGRPMSALQGDCPPGYGPANPELVGERPWLYDVDSRIDLVLRETLRRSWIRFDYLNWNIDGPGNDLLGARMATLDAREPFQAFDPGNIPRVGVAGLVPDLQDVELDNMNGIRATVGIPMQTGSLEFDVWGIAQASQERVIGPQIDLLTGAVVLPAITLTSAGTPSDSTMVLFDTNYRNEIRSTLFGTQANYYFNPMSTATHVTTKPLLGFRYVRFKEELEIQGVDAATGTNPRLSSSSHNNLFGPQVGFRTSVDTEWFSVGIEPKVMFGVNRHEDTVSASDILDPGNAIRTENNDTDFAPVIDLSSYLRINVSRSCSLYGGYQILVLTNASRPSDQIRYDAPLVPTDDPRIGLRKDREAVLTHGFMVGGEFRFQ